MSGRPGEKKTDRPRVMPKAGARLTRPLPSLGRRGTAGQGRTPKAVHCPPSRLALTGRCSCLWHQSSSHSGCAGDPPDRGASPPRKEQAGLLPLPPAESQSWREQAPSLGSSGSSSSCYSSPGVQVSAMESILGWGLLPKGAHQPPDHKDWNYENKGTSGGRGAF